MLKTWVNILAHSVQNLFLSFLFLFIPVRFNGALIMPHELPFNDDILFWSISGDELKFDAHTQYVSFGPERSAFTRKKQSLLYVSFALVLYFINVMIFLSKRILDLRKTKKLQFIL